jgi:hypothetical protein
MFGPQLPPTDVFNTAPQLRHTGHSCTAQHSQVVDSHNAEGADF